MNLTTRVQTLDEAVCISHSANALRKGKNPPILSQALYKIVRQTRPFDVVMVTNLEEGKTLFSNLLNSA